jgi:hypothetical protein
MPCVGEQNMTATSPAPVATHELAMALTLIGSRPTMTGSAGTPSFCRHRAVQAKKREVTGSTPLPTTQQSQVKAKLSRKWSVKAKPRSALVGIVGSGLVVLSCVAATPASGKSPPIPTQKQIRGCVIAVTGEQPLTTGQVAGCKAAVLQTFLPVKCSESPPGYVIDLMGDYRGIQGKAAHEWAIRAGHRPLLVLSDRTTQAVINANIC